MSYQKYPTNLLKGYRTWGDFIAITIKYTYYPICRDTFHALKSSVLKATINITAVSALYLQHNFIHQLHRDAFKRYTDLTYLNLNANGLRIIHDGVFDNISTLTYLYLQNNDIVKLPANFGSSTTTLFSLYLANWITNSQIQYIQRNMHTVFAVLCCGYTLTDFPISIRLTSLALRQSNDCPSASKATVMNMDKYFMWIHYERLHDHNKAKHNKTMCIFLGIYCIDLSVFWGLYSITCSAPHGPWYWQHQSHTSTPKCARLAFNPW